MTSNNKNSVCPITRPGNSYHNSDVQYDFTILHEHRCIEPNGHTGCTCGGDLTKVCDVVGSCPKVDEKGFSYRGISVENCMNYSYYFGPKNGPNTRLVTKISN